MVAERVAHWETIWTEREPSSLSWFQTSTDFSSALIMRFAADRTSRVVDVGGGASGLPGDLLDHGYSALTVVDISTAALRTNIARLGGRGSQVRWISTDVTVWQPDRSFDVWHDRAVFHFLTEPTDRGAYVACAARALDHDGVLIVGTFALDGPDRCSGIPVQRYDADQLGAVFTPHFAMVSVEPHQHVTPSGGVQPFTFVVFRRN